MAQQAATQDKKSFLRNDPLLVCGMLTFYGICILGLIGATIWGLDQRNRKISANTTSTVFALVTEQAKATATVMARTTEQADFDFLERFSASTARWEHGAQNSEYWAGSKNIADGVYIWKVDKVKRTFISKEDFYQGKRSKDFNTYIDTKIVKGNPGKVCSGLMFRMSTIDWKSGSYAFFVCNNSYFKVSYRDNTGWQSLSDWKYSNVIRNSDWNRIEVKARGDHFTLMINHVVVFELTNDRQEEGSLAIFIDVKETNPAVIWFDNFGYQPVR